MDIRVTDNRARFGTYRLDSPNGSITVDIDGPPKQCVVTLCEKNQRRKAFIKDWDMRLIWLAMGKYAPQIKGDK